MADIFISHAEEDADLAIAAAGALERAGYTTWYYERDSVPGLSYLIQCGRAIQQARVVLLIISPASLRSHQVTKEVVRAHEENKCFVPVLHKVGHADFQSQQAEWREALGSAASVSVPAEGIGAIVPRIVTGLRAMGIEPAGNPPAREAALPAAGPANPEPATANRPARVLWVDDEAHILMLAKAILAKCGNYELATATNGEEGLRLAREFRPDAMLLDIAMPGMNGMEVARRVREDGGLAAVKLMMVTAFGADRQRIEAAVGCGVPILVKPFMIDELKAQLAQLLATPAKPPAPVPPRPAPPQPSRPAPATEEDALTLRDYQIRFAERCEEGLRALGLSAAEALDLVEREFRSHVNYFRFDLENYPLPLRSSFIIYLNKLGRRIEFVWIARCTANAAKLASYNDILGLYRRASRMAYRSDPRQIFLSDGALRRVAALHLDLRTRIEKHFETYDALAVKKRVYLLASGDGTAGSGEADEAGQIAFHLLESARAEQEAGKIAEAVEFGDISSEEALGLVVMQLERSLQHMHKVILAYPPTE